MLLLGCINDFPGYDALQSMIAPVLLLVPDRAGPQLDRISAGSICGPALVDYLNLRLAKVRACIDKLAKGSIIVTSSTGDCVDHDHSLALPSIWICK